MPDFENTKIYRIVCENHSYIGATTNIDARLQCHRTACRYYHKNTKLYNFIRHRNWSWEILEHYPCETLLEKNEREQYWIKLLNPCLNTNRAYRTLAEKRECDNIKAKKYYHKNKDKINKKRAKIISDIIYENNGNT